MNTVARLVSALFVSGSLLVVPFVASADQTPAAAHAHKGGPKAHEKLDFPMKGDEFRKVVEGRIEKVKAHVERALDKHNVPAAARTEVGKAVDEAAKSVRAAADKAAADGTVTKDEAKQVRELAKALRAKAREQLEANHAKGGGHKGGKGHHGKKGADA